MISRTLDYDGGKAETVKESLGDLSDARLVAEVGEGDGEAFAELVRRHDRQMRGLVQRLIPGPDPVDDLMQEVWLKVFRALPRFRGEASLSTWLFRVTHNVCMDHLRRRRPAEVAPADESAEPAWPGADPGDVVATRGVLVQAFGRLTQEQRAVALLVDGDGLDYAGAANVLHLATGTVASRLNRARAELRRSLSAAMVDAA